MGAIIDIFKDFSENFIKDCYIVCSSMSYIERQAGIFALFSIIKYKKNINPAFKDLLRELSQDESISIRVTLALEISKLLLEDESSYYQFELNQIIESLVNDKNFTVSRIMQELIKSQKRLSSNYSPNGDSFLSEEEVGNYDISKIQDMEIEFNEDQNRPSENVIKSMKIDEVDFM